MYEKGMIINRRNNGGIQMLKSNIKNGEILKRLALMGEGDALTIVGHRFALPENVDVIDVSIAEDLPTIEQVTEIITKDMIFSEITLPHEMDEDAKELIKGKVDSMKLNELTIRQVQVVAKNTRFVIRTGDGKQAGALVLRI